MALHATCDAVLSPLPPARIAITLSSFARRSASIPANSTLVTMPLLSASHMARARRQGRKLPGVSFETSRRSTMPSASGGSVTASWPSLSLSKRESRVSHGGTSSGSDSEPAYRELANSRPSPMTATVIGASVSPPTHHRSAPSPAA